MQAIGYIRVSTTEQANEGTSLEMQAEKIQAYCSLNNLNLVGIVEDAGLSAKSTKRPGLQNILNMIQKSEVQAVVVYKLDRLSRNVQDMLNIASLLDSKGCSLHSITEKLDTHSAMGRFFFQLTASLGEMERNLIAERTTAALDSKRQRGEWIGGRPSYGHKAVNGQLVEDPEEQQVLNRIQALKHKGYSTRKIVGALKEEGIKTRKGGYFNQTQVCRILKAA